MIKPAIRKIKKLKINIAGPFSADSLFLSKNEKKILYTPIRKGKIFHMISFQKFMVG